METGGIALRSRYRGALAGLAAGDAVGTTLEFTTPGTFAPITDMVGGGPFRLEPGQWTDDTSMALCLAESLAECRGFDARDQMTRYLEWHRNGKFRAHPGMRDIGNTTRRALERFERTGEPFSGDDDPNSAANGSLMRLAPVPLFFFHAGRARVMEMAAASSKTTHGLELVADACRWFASLIFDALTGLPKAAILAAEPPSSLDPKIAAVARGSWRNKPQSTIRGSGYVVASLEAALWAFDTTSDFRSGCLAAANLGEDADTTAAIYGQLAGAHYGFDAIPAEWRERLAHRELIVALADRLHDEALALRD
jgi:ADP-ribosylglycohydrolase